tara:strand:+ start:167 stop:580 length:414 start_codon:yes stop_codon:yes gene_type:complete
MKLHKWGAERLLSYYTGVDDWGCQQYDEDKYNPIIHDVLTNCIKTGNLKIPKKYPELFGLFSCDMHSGLSMDEMDLDQWKDETTECCLKYNKIDYKNLKIVCKQYRNIIKSFNKLPKYDIQFKHKLYYEVNPEEIIN